MHENKRKPKWEVMLSKLSTVSFSMLIRFLADNGFNINNKIN